MMEPTVDDKSKTERQKQLIGIIIDNSKVEFSGLERNARDDIRILARAKHLAEYVDVDTIRPDPGLANMIKRTQNNQMAKRIMGPGLRELFTSTYEYRTPAGVTSMLVSRKDQKIIEWQEKHKLLQCQMPKEIFKIEKMNNFSQDFGSLSS